MTAQPNGFNSLARHGLLLAVLLALPGLTGCKSPPPGADGSLAWVEITGRTPAAILKATTSVFAENGYRLASSAPDKLTFEKVGDGMTGLKYGTWVSGALERVEVSVTRHEGQTYLLHCQIFMVRNAGDRILEDKQKKHFGRAPYQELLEKVKSSLAASP